MLYLSTVGVRSPAYRLAILESPVFPKEVYGSDIERAAENKTNEMMLHHSTNCSGQVQDNFGSLGRGICVLVNFIDTSFIIYTYFIRQSQTADQRSSIMKDRLVEWQNSPSNECLDGEGLNLRRRV
jgi:hypothetical protein